MTPIATQVKRLEKLLGMLRPVPDSWVKSNPAKATDGEQMECRPCHSYAVLRVAWKKAAKFTEWMDCTLSVMLASAMSTRFIGEQLWVKIIGPASSFKTTLLEGLAVNKKYVLSKDTIRGFYSGWKSNDGEDDSIAALARNMTLATKDGDTLLKAPNREQILSEARGLYDGVGRTHYRNQVSHEYERHRMTWILCGTKALREIDDSELGGRMLDCVVMDEIDDEFEDAVGFRSASQEARNMLIESDGTMESAYAPERVAAMTLTGGYLDYLRENAARLTGQVKVNDDHFRRFNQFGKFTAYMRARPPRSKGRDEDEVEREFSPRLTKQFTRLAMALAAVLNKTEIDHDVMWRVKKVALDTSRGHTLQIVNEMLAHPQGVTPTMLSHKLAPSEEKLAKLLRFLRQIGVCETVDYTTTDATTGKKIRTKRLWRVTAKLRKLYEEVHRA